MGGYHENTGQHSRFICRLCAGGEPNPQREHQIRHSESNAERKTILNHRQFLGYTKGPDGVLQIVPEEAEIVRKIFDLYIQGNGVRKIKKYLESHGIKTVTGKTEWSTSTIDRMLSNENMWAKC